MTPGLVHDPHLRLRLAGWFADRCSGACLALMVAYAAHLLAGFSGLPAMALAMLLGLLLRVLLPEPRFEPGYAFMAGNVLRFGIVLLGARLSLGDIAAVGWHGAITASAVVLVVFGCGWWAGRHPRIGRELGLIAGGAVAICGASAAAAMAALLPASARREQAVIGAVAGVSLVGAMLMLLYPWLLGRIGLAPDIAGLFIGASIHDVAQTAGAGYALGAATGDAAMITKLMRVAWLAPLALIAGLALRTGGDAASRTRPPLFLLFFLFMLGIAATGLLPESWRQACDTISRTCLLVAIAAMGLRTAPRQLLRQGGPAFLLVALLSLLAILLAAGGASLSVFLS